MRPRLGGVIAERFDGEEKKSHICVRDTGNFWTLFILYTILMIFFNNKNTIN